MEFPTFPQTIVKERKRTKKKENHRHGPFLSPKLLTGRRTIRGMDPPRNQPIPSPPSQSTHPLPPSRNQPIPSTRVATRGTVLVCTLFLISRTFLLVFQRWNVR